MQYAFFKMKCIKTRYVTPNSPHFAPQGIYAPSNSCCKIVNQPHPPRPPRLEKITDIHISIVVCVAGTHQSRKDRSRTFGGCGQPQISTT